MGLVAMSSTGSSTVVSLDPHEGHKYLRLVAPSLRDLESDTSIRPEHSRQFISLPPQCGGRGLWPPVPLSRGMHSQAGWLKNNPLSKQGIRNSCSSSQPQ